MGKPSQFRRVSRILSSAYGPGSRVEAGDFAAFENREGEVLVGRVVGADVGALDVLVPSQSACDPHGQRSFRVSRNWAALISKGRR